MATARGEWSKLDHKFTPMLKKLEQYAAYTIPRLMTPQGYDSNSESLRHDWQSVGAQAVNHVVNKLVLTLFAPSRPFIRLQANPQWKAEQLASGALTEADIDDALAEAEIAAVRELDMTEGMRPKMYGALASLVVLGNVLMYLPADKKEAVRIINIKQFRVRRTGAGAIKVLMTKQCLKFDELETKVQEAVKANARGNRFNDRTEVNLFVWVKRDSNGGYTSEQWVDDVKLPEEFSGAYKDDKVLPYRVLTWQLLDGADYGSGLVEDYEGDFAALSALSEAQVKGAILASEFRWLCSPTGMTKPEDLENSANGDVIPGQEGDVSLISTQKGNDLAIVQGVVQDYIRRIGQGFLLGSSVTRDAERVTAEEIRMQAQELETSYGGAYSRIALEMQGPIGRWALNSINLSLKDTQIVMSIITGLDALSRSGDLDALRAALSDVAAVTTLPEQSQQFLKLDAIFSTIFAGHGLQARKFVKTADEVAQAQQAQQAQMTTNQATEAAAVAGAEAVAQGPQAQ